MVVANLPSAYIPTETRAHSRAEERARSVAAAVRTINARKKRTRQLLEREDDENRRAYLRGRYEALREVRDLIEATVSQAVAS